VTADSIETVFHGFESGPIRTVLVRPLYSAERLDLCAWWLLVF